MATSGSSQPSGSVGGSGGGDDKKPFDYKNVPTGPKKQRGGAKRGERDGRGSSVRGLGGGLQRPAGNSSGHAGQGVRGSAGNSSTQAPGASGSAGNSGNTREGAEKYKKGFMDEEGVYVADPVQYMPPPNHFDMAEIPDGVGSVSDYGFCAHCFGPKRDGHTDWRKCPEVCGSCEQWDHQGKFCPRRWCTKAWYKTHYGSVPKPEDGVTRFRPTQAEADALVEDGHEFFKRLRDTDKKRKAGAAGLSVSERQRKVRRDAIGEGGKNAHLRANMKQATQRYEQIIQELREENERLREENERLQERNAKKDQDTDPPVKKEEPGD